MGMPFSSGGLVGYDDDGVKSKYQIKPKYVIVLGVIVIVAFTILTLL